MLRTLLCIAGLMAFFGPPASAQSYTLETTWSTSGAAGGIGVLSEDAVFVSITDLGHLNKLSGGVVDASVAMWVNPLDGADTVALVGGISTGPRGITLDPFGNVLTLSNDTDHNVLVWETDLAAASKRLKTSLDSGSDGRIYAIDTDDLGRLYIFRYYNIPPGHHRLEVYPAVSLWGTSHEETPLSSTTLEEVAPYDAYEGMCVNGAGTVVWYTGRGGRVVHRLAGSPSGGYTEDAGFSLNLADGTASTGFRALALNPDESRIFICDNMDQRIIVANATTGAIDSGLSFSTGGLSAYDVELDDAANAYVAYYGPPAKVDKFAYVSPTPTPTPTVTPTGTIYPTSTPSAIPFSGHLVVDNSDPGCTVLGTWPVSTTACYGPNKFTHAPGSGSDTVTWTEAVPPGWYLVYFWVNANTTYATDAGYSVTHRDGSSNVTISQRRDADGWYLLGGSYYFDGTATVELSDLFSGGSLLSADAVRFTSVFSFVQMSDSHVGYTRGTANTTAVADELKTLGTVTMGSYGFTAPPPSFAIHSGDFTEYGQEYWNTLMSVFSGMPFPIYFAQGNHDSTWSSCKERIRSLYGSPAYAFDHYDHDLRYHFVTLNSPIIQSPRAGFSREELDWLASDLASLEPNTPVFMNFHHPITGTSDPKPYDTYRLLETIRPYRVLIGFYGHGHSVVKPTFDGLQLLQGGSTYNDSTDIGCSVVIAVTQDRIWAAKKLTGEPTASTNVLNYAVPAGPTYPMITVSAPAKDSQQTSSSVAVTASISGAAGSVTAAEFELDGDGNWRALSGTGYGPYTGSVDLSSSVHGRHWIRVRFTMSTEGPWHKMVPFWHFDSLPRADWIVDLGAASLSMPAVADGRVYVGADGGSMRCCNAANGSELWKVDLPSDVVSSPAVADGRVIFGCGNGMVYCRDAATGSPIWEFPTSGPVYSSPTIEGNAVYIGTIGTGDAGSRILYSLNTATGAKNWEFSAGNAIETKPCVYDNTVFFGAWDSYFYAVYTGTGLQRWRYQRNSNRYYSPADSWPAASASSNRVFVADRQYYMNAINVTSGAYDWLGTSVSSQAVTPDGAGLLQRLTSGALVRTTFSNGSVWSTPCSLDSAPVAPMSSGERAVIVDQDGLASVISLATGSVEYQFQVAQGYQLNPVAIDSQGRIYASTYDGFLLAAENALEVHGWYAY